MRTGARHLGAVAAICLGVWCAGCEPDFAPYNEVQGLRVLGLRADPAELLPAGAADAVGAAAGVTQRPGQASAEVSTLTALVSDDQASYRWSWCPLATPAGSDSDCPIGSAELDALRDALGLDQAALPPLVLGNEPSAQFAYGLAEGQLQWICVLLLSGLQASLGGSSQNLPIPDCSGRALNVRIRLEVESATERVRAIRDLALLFSRDSAPNQNPRLMQLQVDQGGRLMPLTGEPAVELERGAEHRLEFELAPESVETYIGDNGDPQREDLTATWFTEGGEYDQTRTSFREGETSLDNLRSNSWIAPMTADYPRDTARLWVVLRDGRGGVDWQERRVRLIAP